MKCFTTVTLHRIFLVLIEVWGCLFFFFFCSWRLCVFQTFVSKAKGDSSLPSWLVSCQMSQIMYKCTILLSWFFSRKCLHCHCFCFWLAIINMHTHHHHCYCLLPANNIKSIRVFLFQLRIWVDFFMNLSMWLLELSELLLSDVTSSYFIRLRGPVQTHWN